MSSDCSRCGPPVRSVSFRLSQRDAFLPSFLSLRAFLQLREPLPAAVHHPRVSLSERVGPRHLVSMVVVVVVVTVAAGGAQVGERVRRARRVPEPAVREHRPMSETRRRSSPRPPTATAWSPRAPRAPARARCRSRWTPGSPRAAGREPCAGSPPPTAAARPHPSEPAMWRALRGDCAMGRVPR